MSIGLVLALGGQRIAAAEDPPRCLGEYAEDLSALSSGAREVESHTASYSYAVRTAATYECVSYGSDGTLKKAHSSTLAYGTAFGYRRDGDDTLLLTNEHVAEWPAVTDDNHPVDGVPAGCKRISDSLKIVDDDHDDYAADDIPLARVVVDPALDVAVLRAHAKLEILPWRIGKSATLVARDAVEVKGFPLGEFQATNVGKVISAYDHDDQGDWNHDDFVVDALLSSGGSGSPVLAVSCKTGEFELVGIFHAHYSSASALNVVIAIDQVRDLMTTLKRSPHPADSATVLDAAARARLAEAAHGDSDPPFFFVGSQVASMRERADGTFVFALFPTDFPKTTTPLLVVEDLPGDDPQAFGTLGPVYVGGALGLQVYALAQADADSTALVSRTLALLREDALATFEVRAAGRAPTVSRDAFDRTAKKKRALARMLDAQRDSAQAIGDFVVRATSHLKGTPIGLAELAAGPIATALAKGSEAGAIRSPEERSDATPRTANQSR